jgi:tRNA threonylcarbamoyladenosine biosynthesis protein TsaE
VATFISHSVEETIAFARDWAQSLGPDDVVALIGDLGAGKTQFVKGLVAGLGCAVEVTSPTFTLLHEYNGGRLPVFHFDFYRLSQRAEVEDIAFHDYLKDDGVVVIEWADRFADLLPEHTRWVRLEARNGTERRIREQ